MAMVDQLRAGLTDERMRAFAAPAVCSSLAAAALAFRQAWRPAERQALNRWVDSTALQLRLMAGRIPRDWPESDALFDGLHLPAHGGRAEWGAFTPRRRNAEP